MAKIIKYKFVAGERNTGAEEKPNVEQIILDKEMECKTQTDFDANYPVVGKEAIPGTIEVSGEFDDEPTEPTQEERITELEEALEMLLNGVTE